MTDSVTVLSVRFNSRKTSTSRLLISFWPFFNSWIYEILFKTRFIIIIIIIIIKLKNIFTDNKEQSFSNVSKVIHRKIRRTITRIFYLFKVLIFTGYKSKTKSHKHRIEADAHFQELSVMMKQLTYTKFKYNFENFQFCVVLISSTASDADEAPRISLRDKNLARPGQIHVPGPILSGTLRPYQLKIQAWIQKS